MKVNAIALNETHYYAILGDDKSYIKEIRSTYCYDPELAVHCCELTPSHELQYLHTFIVWEGDPPAEKQEELIDRYCYCGSDAAIYVHVADVRQFAKDCPHYHKECVEFEDMDAAAEHLNANWPF